MDSCNKFLIYYITSNKTECFEQFFLLLVDNQLDAQFLMYVYFYSLHV